MKTLNVNETKQEFVKSIHKWLMHTLKQNGSEKFSDCFQIEGNSIMCRLPENYFSAYNIPKDTLIEMKFVSKRN